MQVPITIESLQQDRDVQLEQAVAYLRNRLGL